MAAGCTDTTGRTTWMGITQDSTCVSWDKLVQLRTDYNLIWNQLAVCGQATGSKFGEFPHFEEINSLPSMEGFFRISVGHAGVGEAIECNVEKIQFILTSGLLLWRLEDPNFSYLDMTPPDGHPSIKPFVALLQDECTNCSKFHPTRWENAAKTVQCGAGNTRNLYVGFKALDFTQAPPGCGNIYDWGSAAGIAKLSGYLDSFPCYKVVGAPAAEGDCETDDTLCCDNTYMIAHYDSLGLDGAGNDRLVLKYIDIMVQADGTSQMSGYLTALIYADELQDIRQRLIRDIPKFSFGGSDTWRCDPCAPDFSEESCYPETSSSRGYYFSCENSPTYDMLAKSYACTGNDSCDACSEGSITGGDVICACSWLELYGVMVALSRYCCVLCTATCADCTCGSRFTDLKTRSAIRNSCGTSCPTDTPPYLATYGDVKVGFSGPPAGCSHYWVDGGNKIVDLLVEGCPGVLSESSVGTSCPTECNDPITIGDLCGEVSSGLADSVDTAIYSYVIPFSDEEIVSTKSISSSGDSVYSWGYKWRMRNSPGARGFSISWDIELFDGSSWAPYTSESLHLGPGDTSDWFFYEITDCGAGISYSMRIKNIVFTLDCV